MLRLMDKPQDTPTLPARYYRQKAVEALRQQKKRQRQPSKSGCTARLAISISWPMPLTELGKQQTRPRGLVRRSLMGDEFDCIVEPTIAHQDTIFGTALLKILPVRLKLTRLVRWASII